MLRIDPVEGYGILIKNVHACVNGKRIRIFALNGQDYSAVNFFFTKDPQYIMFGNFKKGDAVEVEFCVESILNYEPCRIQNGQVVQHDEFEATIKTLRQRVYQTVRSRVKKAYVYSRWACNRLRKES